MRRMTVVLDDWIPVPARPPVTVEPMTIDVSNIDSSHGETFLIPHAELPPRDGLHQAPGATE